MKQVKIIVNGRTVQATEGSLLIHVLRDLGVILPTLCHDNRLAPYGGCRLCVVEQVGDRGGLVPACSTPVKAGMAVDTESEMVAEARRRQLQLLLLNHRMECPVCVRRTDCRFQDLVFTYGIRDESLPFEPPSMPPRAPSPIINHDLEKCIICGKCTRLCEEVQGVSAITLVNRGIHTRVATFRDQPLDCEFCGQCVNTCPVAALTAQPYTSNVPVWLRQEVVTTCSFCSCGCQIRAQTYEGALQSVDAVEGAEPNNGKLCARGWLGTDLLGHPDRLRHPLVRRDGVLVEVEWAEAVETIREALERRPAGSMAAFASARCTCEDGFLLHRFLEAYGAFSLGLGPEPGLRALRDGVAPVLGRARSSARISDLRRVGLVVVLRTDPTDSHPLVKTELIQRITQDRRPVVLACPDPTGLARHATTTLRPAPGREADLVYGLAHELHTLGRLRHGTGLSGSPRWFESVAAFDPDSTARATGLEVEAIRSLARAVAEVDDVVFVVPTARGVAGDEATVGKAAACLTAALGPNAGLLVLPERCNLQGLLDIDFGFAPDRTAADSFSGALSGEVQTLYLVGQDPIAAWPRQLEARAALEAAELVIVQDAFLTETARLADVVLPATILGERDGTVVGADGIARELHRVVSPPAGSRDDGDIVRGLAAAIGVDLPSAEETAGEVARRLAAHASETDATLSAVPRPGKPTAELELALFCTPQLFHSGSVTRKSPTLSQLGRRTSLRLNPDDAAERGISDGDAVRVSSAGHHVLMQARLDPQQRRGRLSAPWNTTRDGAAALSETGSDVVDATIRRSS